MENLFDQSRALITNKIHQKYQNERYLRHKQTIDKIRATESCYHQRTPTIYLRNINKSKQAHKQVGRLFDPSLLENKALVKKLVDTEMRETRANSFINAYKFHSRKNSEERKKIKQENQILRAKIQAQRRKILSIKELKKQFKEHDRNVQQIRKIKPKN